MAILNITPDSFSDGGLHTPADPTSLLETARAFLAAGATILDIGGQSTRPHAPQVTAEEELARVLPALELIHSLPESDGAILSVDTYRASVARAAIAAGAHMVNDISAGRLDEDMLPTLAELGVTVCLMHSRGTPATMNKLNSYGPLSSPSSPTPPASPPAGAAATTSDGAAAVTETEEADDNLISTIAAELLARVAAAEAAGVRRWRIVLDPGLGFAKLGAQNLTLLRRLDELRRWPGLRGLPWLVGASRKSFVGRATGVEAPRERVWGTAAATAAAVAGGADIVRVHDVREMAQVAAMADAIWRV